MDNKVKERHLAFTEVLRSKLYTVTDNCVLVTEQVANQLEELGYTVFLYMKDSDHRKLFRFNRKDAALLVEEKKGPSDLITYLNMVLSPANLETFKIQREWDFEWKRVRLDQYRMKEFSDFLFEMKIDHGLVKTKEEGGHWRWTGLRLPLHNARGAKTSKLLARLAKKLESAVSGSWIEWKLEDLKNSFEANLSSFASEYDVVVSDGYEDILCASTFQDWDSCYNVVNGMYGSGPVYSYECGDKIAYLYKGGMKSPVGRVILRVDASGKRWWPETKVYMSHTAVGSFGEKVVKDLISWLEKRGECGLQGEDYSYHSEFIGYSDRKHGMITPPPLSFDEVEKREEERRKRNLRLTQIDLKRYGAVLSQEKRNRKKSEWGYYGDPCLLGFARRRTVARLKDFYMLTFISDSADLVNRWECGQLG